jgi:hypothetical protein
MCHIWHLGELAAATLYACVTRLLEQPQLWLRTWRSGVICGWVCSQSVRHCCAPNACRRAAALHLCLHVQAWGWAGWLDVPQQCFGGGLFHDLTCDAAAVPTLQWVAHCGFCDPLACGPHHLPSLFVVWFWIVQVISLLVVLVMGCTTAPLLQCRGVLCHAV